MDEVEERFSYEEEEVTTIHRKTVRKESTTRRKKQAGTGKGRKEDVVARKAPNDIKLNPYIVGAKSMDHHVGAGTPPLNRKVDLVQKLVQETLNEYKGRTLPQKQQKSRNTVFFGAFDSDDEEQGQTSSRVQQTRKWSFTVGNKVHFSYNHLKTTTAKCIIIMYTVYFF